MVLSYVPPRGAKRLRSPVQMLHGVSMCLPLHTFISREHNRLCVIKPIIIQGIRHGRDQRGQNEAHDNKYISFPTRYIKTSRTMCPVNPKNTRCTFWETNGAFEYCDAGFPYRNGDIVGRIGAIINRKANELWNQAIRITGWTLSTTWAVRRAVRCGGIRAKDLGQAGARPLGFTDPTRKACW